MVNLIINHLKVYFLKQKDNKAEGMEKFELNKNDLRALLYLCNARKQGITIEMFLYEFINEYRRERSKREDSCKCPDYVNCKRCGALNTMET